MCCWIKSADFWCCGRRHAETISQRLKAVGVNTDYRGEGLRLGPAPYLSDAQIIEAIERLGRVCRGLAPGD